MWRQTTSRLVAEALGVKFERPATVKLRDGTVGWCVRPGRRDDCFASALATCLQVPIDQCPDPEIDRRLTAGETIEAIDASAWQQLNDWLYRRGILMTYHTTPPAHRRRYVGVIAAPGAFEDHTVVCDRREILFDPAIWQQVADGDPVPDARVCEWTFEDIAFGFSFRSTDKPKGRHG